MYGKTNGVMRFLWVACLCVWLFIPAGISNAQTAIEELEDGAYAIDYVILHAETESVSIANDYFEKPAILYVEDDKKYIQFPLNHSKWTKELQAPSGDDFVDVDVIDQDEKEDTRVVEFKLDQDLTEPLEFKMHVLIETMDPVYDHRYTVRFDFDTESLESLEDEVREPPKVKEEPDQPAANEKDENAAAETMNTEEDAAGTTDYIIWMVAGIIGLIVVVLVAYLIWRKSKK